MTYDPNWLQKERAKKANRPLSHIEDKSIVKTQFEHSTMLCGQGWGAKGHVSITVVQFPSIDSLPTCRQCREKFLTSIGVPFNEIGYPILTNQIKSNNHEQNKNNTCNI